jgi:hypothetical protein
MAKSKNIENCFSYFPQFRVDYPVLESTGIIKRSGRDNYEWTKSKTSLAQYFKWIAGNDKYRTEGGFWNPINAVFLIKGEPIKTSLSHNASRNGNEAKKEYSKDFIKIKNIVETYREKVKREEAVKEYFQKIKGIVESSGKGSFQESDRALKKIVKAIESYKNFVSKNE